MEDDDAHESDGEAVVSDEVEAPPEESEALEADAETDFDAALETDEVSSEAIVQADTAPEETTTESPQTANDQSEEDSVVDAGGAVAPEEKAEEG